MRNRLNLQIQNGWAYSGWGLEHLAAARFLLARLFCLCLICLCLICLCLICLCLICLFISTQSILFAQSATPSALYDPLSASEEQAALNAAFAAGAAAGADSITAASVLKQEVLLVERHQESKEERKSGRARRRSDAYIYDYTANTLRHVIVNLENQEVEVVEELRGVQLPLTSNEAAHAYYLAFSNESLRKRLNDAFRQVTGEALTAATQLDIKAFIFTADAMPDAVNEYSEQCGIHRCAQIQFYTQENMVLDVQPIVDLSREMVVQDVLNIEADLTGVEGIDSDTGTESDDDRATGDGNEDEDENGDESSFDSQPDSAGNMDSSSNSGEIFLPFVARKFFKDGSLSNELILDQVLFLWWCDWMSRAQGGNEPEGICFVQENFE